MSITNISNTCTNVPKEKKSKLMLSISKNWQLYMFLLLPMAYLLIFKYYPMLGIQIAFKKFITVKGIWGSPWVGMNNFNKFFHSYQFLTILKNTLIVSIYHLAAAIPVSIILGLAINAVRSQAYKKLVQTVTYIPHFISVVVLVGIVFQVFDSRTGLYGIIGQWLSGTSPRNVLGTPGAFPHLYVWSGIWQSMGWSTIIYVAALSNVDPEMHEAAKIDGANRFKRVLHIDFPSIIPTATIILIMDAGRIMSVGFEKVFLFQNNLNLSTSEVISTYVYKVGLAAGGGDFSYATAIGLFNSVVNLILIMIVNSIAKRVSTTSLW